MTAALRTILSAVFLLTVSTGLSAAEKLRPLDPEVETFIEEMVQKHQFEAAALRKLFGQVKPRPGIVKAMSAPATARPWHEFRIRYIEPAFAPQQVTPCRDGTIAYRSFRFGGAFGLAVA